MPIDPSKVTWDAPDPAKVVWDGEAKEEPKKDTRQRTLDQIGGLLRGAGSIGSTLIELGRSGGTRGEPFSTLIDRYKADGKVPVLRGIVSRAGQLAPEDNRVATLRVWVDHAENSYSVKA